MITASFLHGPRFWFSPQTYIRRLITLTILWTFACILAFKLNYFQRPSSFYVSSNLNRELFQQGPDYIYVLNTPTKKSVIELPIRIDRSHSPNEKELLKIALKDFNLPAAYWADTKLNKSGKDSCSQFPSIYELDFNNIYWQRLTTTKATFYLFGAYYDTRKLAGNVPLIRIIGMVDKVKPPPTYCQFWYDENANVIKHSFSKANYTYMWNSDLGHYEDANLQPFVISCPVMANANYPVIPASVSLVEKRCSKPTNNLKVIYNKPWKKYDFGVCVKGLDFLYEDISVRLIEWIELLNILGAKKIFFYELETHKNIRKVISYYQQRGLVEITPLTLPGNQPNLPGFRHLYLKSKVMNKRLNELIPYNDCLYKNMYSYDYLALLDIDEVIMPAVHENWKDLMAEVLKLALTDKNYNRASYNFRHVYFLDDLQDAEQILRDSHEKGIPQYLYMLPHVYRSKNYAKPGAFVKSFHNTELAVSLYNHFPLNCFGQCTNYSVDTSLAQMQHYRKNCIDDFKKECKSFRSDIIRDTKIWRYKDDLIRRTNRTLSDLGFFNNNNPFKVR